MVFSCSWINPWITHTAHFPVATSLPRDAKLTYFRNLSDDYHRRKHAETWLKSLLVSWVRNGAYFSMNENVLFFIDDCGDGHAARLAKMIRRLVVETIL